MYTVIINGVPIQCETAAAAIELTRQAAAEGVDSGMRGERDASFDSSPVSSRWNERRIREFFGHLQSGSQRKLLDALFEAEDGMTDGQLVPLLGLEDNRGLAGVLAGLYKNAKKVGADPTEVYQRATVSIGDRQQYEYRLVDSFRGAVKKWRP